MKPAFILGLILLGAPLVLRAAEPPSRTVFDQLKALAGDWRSTRANGETTVNYKLIANGTSLVETWTMSPGRQSMTVYTMDGERLLATHYCPQGNAPQLYWSRTDEQGAHHFAFSQGANLRDPQGTHQHAFWILSAPNGLLIRSETYIRNGTSYNPQMQSSEQESFTRNRSE